MKIKDINREIDIKSNIELYTENTKITVKYNNFSYEKEITSSKDYDKFKKLIMFCDQIKIEFPDLMFEIDGDDHLWIEGDLWDDAVNIGIEEEDFEWFKLLVEISKYIKIKNNQIIITVNQNDDQVITLKLDSWRTDIVFGNNDDQSLEEISDSIMKFFKSKYDGLKCCYHENYIEYPIRLAKDQWGVTSFYDFYTIPEDIKNDGITFEISQISEFFYNHCIKGQNTYGFDQNYNECNITTLKIYNLNKFLGITIDDKNFYSEGLSAARNIIFNLSHKNSINLDIAEFPDFDDESFFNDDLPEEACKLTSVEDHNILKLYDNDLINYFYRAMNMEDSEFKYLAYYQILECIFDEVQLHATIQDVKQLINSDWFSKHSDKDIREIIDIVETYNKQKKDRDKLQLVLEKYLKGSLNDKAYLLANRTIIKQLIDMEKIKKEDEFKDLNKLVSIIYDYRCRCTHSNRTYPFRSTFEGTNEELSKYIVLIKRFAEKIIINYQVNNS